MYGARQLNTGVWRLFRGPPRHRGTAGVSGSGAEMRPNTTAGSVSVIFLAACVGCASLPTTGVRPTGEPLGFDFETSQHGYMTSEKVGEVQYRGAAGQNL